MDRTERKRGIRAGLHHAWQTALLAAEAMSASPMEDLADRIARLEREVAMMKKDAAGSAGDQGRRLEHPTRSN
jgi:hypothetical protein